jgi:DNA-directed RNA polymerase subunit alpha
MANAVEKLINDELKSIDEMLTIHAYHKQVLQSLMEKINLETGKIERSIDTLPITVRAVNCLKSEGINTVEQLLSMTEVELMKIPLLGKLSLKSIRNALAESGLTIGQSRRYHANKK